MLLLINRILCPIYRFFLAEEAFIAYKITMSTRYGHFTAVRVSTSLHEVVKRFYPKISSFPTCQVMDPRLTGSNSQSHDEDVCYLLICSLISSCDKETYLWIATLYETWSNMWMPLLVFGNNPRLFLIVWNAWTEVNIRSFQEKKKQLGFGIQFLVPFVVPNLTLSPPARIWFHYWRPIRLGGRGYKAFASGTAEPKPNRVLPPHLVFPMF